jgi:hypothetical protein
MTNDELASAINWAHEAVRRTGHSESCYTDLVQHLRALLRAQIDRAGMERVGGEPTVIKWDWPAEKAQ